MSRLSKIRLKRKRKSKSKKIETGNEHVNRKSETFEEIEKDVRSVTSKMSNRGRSLALGSYGSGGEVVKFESSLAADGGSSLASTAEVTELNSETSLLDNNNDMNSNGSTAYWKVKSAISGLFHYNKSSFMRISDLHDLSSQIQAPAHGDGLTPHFHHPSPNLPPGIDHYDPREFWVALDDGAGQHAPIAPLAVQALAKTGMDTAMRDSMWKADKKTNGTLHKSYHWALHGPLHLDQVPYEYSHSDVFVWTGTFTHGLYGSDVPSIRSEGIIPMSPESLLDLLIDSSRVSEYNKSSVGRHDLLVLQDDMHTEGPFGKSITKVVRSQSRPPLLRKTIQFITLLHAKELPCGGGYLIVSRAVSGPQQHNDAKVMKSEVLMGVSIIRRVHGNPDQCILTNVNHINTSIPLMIMRRLGLAAAVTFYADLRALC